jgi:hypothetical protein
MDELFYIVPVSDPNFKEIVAISTNFASNKPRCNLAETKAVIQVRLGYNPSPLLDPYTPIKRAECVTLMQSDEWQNNSI